MKKNILPLITITVATILILGMLIWNNISIATTLDSIQAISLEPMNEEIIKTQSKVANDDGLASEKYTVSDLYTYISRIPPKTEISKFKNGFNVGADKIHIYKDASIAEEVQDGYIKTNMYVAFNGIENKYLALVAGDINGDGLANQVEIQRLIKHIIGTRGGELTGTSFICADLNNDGRVNQADIKILIDYIVFGRIVIDPVDRPSSPKVEIVAGALGENGYYTTYPKIRITETQMKNVGKSTYKLDGTIKKEETDIENNGIIELTTNGTYTITGYTYSKEGVKSKGESKTINVAVGTPAMPTITISETANENGWYKENVTVTITPGSGDSTNIKGIRYKVTGANEIPEEDVTGQEGKTISITANGTSKVIAYTIDEAGNLSEKATLDISKDTQAPENVTLTVREAGPLKLKTTATGTDAISGIAKYEFYVKKAGETEFTKASTENSTLESYTYTYENLTTGTTNMFVRVYDEAGNYTDCEAITGEALSGLPESAPKIEIIGNGPVNDCYTGDVTIKITPGTITDGEVKGIKYIIEGPNGRTEQEVAGTDPVEIPITSNGTTTVTAYTVDSEGNLSDPTTVVINKLSGEYEPPRITVSGEEGENGYYTGDVTVKIEVPYDSSEVVGITYEITGDGAVKKKTVTGNEVTFTITGDGESTVIATVIDKAGNESVVEKKVILKDETPPRMVNITYGAPTDKTIPVTVKGVDEESGIAKYKFEYKEKESSNWITKDIISVDTNEYDYTYEGLKPDTEYQIRVTAIDKAGNEKTSEIIEIKTEDIPDTVSPTAPKITLSGTEGKNGWYTSDVIVRITPGTDEGSGVKGIRYRVEGVDEQEQVETNTAVTKSLSITKDGTSRIIAYTIDNAGNLSVVATKDVKVCKEGLKNVTLSVIRRKYY